jgi:hypothetical protein
VTATRRAIRALVGIVALAALVAPARHAHAQSPHVYVRDIGPGIVGRLLRDALTGPHAVIVAPDTGVVLLRNTDIATTLVVVGGPVRLEGHVRGDLIALGTVVLRPGATVDGRVISIGGIIANSALATVRGARLRFDDVGFAVTRTGPNEYALDYRTYALHEVPTLSLPNAFGFRIPSYDRIDGLSLGFGPEIALDTGRVRIDPYVTYRSHIGEIDPGATVTVALSRRSTIVADAQRGTFTNDRWMRGDILNSAASLASGADARNYYRADRAQLVATHDFETSRAIITPFVGGSIERAWSVARDSDAVSKPFSAFNRDDREEGMLRPNPRVTGGHITSALVGARGRVLRGPITGGASASVEIPVTVTADARFTQITLDGNVGFTTFREQRFVALTHGVATFGDRPPSQRFAYLGGATTIPTLPLLSEGGDQLLWLETRYIIPVNAIQLPKFGAPSVTFRHIVGGARVDRLPTLTQNVGIRLGVAFLRADFVIDPSDTSRHELTFGFGFR